MAEANSYVEHIKVGGGETWALRDKETAEQVAKIAPEVASLSNTVGLHKTNIETMTADLDALSKAISSANAKFDDYLPKDGGTLLGPLYLVKGIHYDTTLPETASKGRVFFKLISDDTTPEEPETDEEVTDE